MWTAHEDTVLVRHSGTQSAEWSGHQRPVALSGTPQSIAESTTEAQILGEGASTVELATERESVATVGRLVISLYCVYFELFGRTLCQTYEIN